MDTVSIIDCLTKSPEPMSIAALKKEVKTPGLDVESALNELAVSGEIFEHPPRQRNQKPRYWHSSPSAFVVKLIEKLASKPVTKASIRSRIPSAYRDCLEDGISEGIQKGRLNGWKKGNSFFVSTDAPSLHFLLNRSEKTLLDVLVAKIHDSGRPHVSIETLTSFLETTPTPDFTKELLRTWYDEDRAKLTKDSPMPISWPWKRYQTLCASNGHQADPGVLQELLKSLSDAQEIVLSNHDAPQLLPPEEATLPFHHKRNPHAYYFQFL